MQLSHRLGRAITWNVVAAASTSGANLLTALILGNTLGREIFGEFAIVQSTVISAAGVAQLAMGLTATKFVAQYRDESKDRAGRILGLCTVVTALTGLLGSLVLSLGASVISTQLLRVPSLGGSIALAGSVVLFATMNGFQVGGLAGMEQYRAIAIAGLMCAAFHVALCAAAALLGGLRGVIIALLVSASVRWLLFNIALRREAARQGIRIAAKGLFHESVMLFTFALPAALSGLSALLAIWIGNALLVRQQNGLSEMGLYAAVATFRALLLLFPALANNVGLSVINSFAEIRDARPYRTAFWANFWVTSVSLAIGAAALLLFGDAFLGLFGQDFIEGKTLLRVVIGGAVLEGISIAAYQIVQSRARMWTSLWVVSLPRDCMMIGVAWWLIPHYGAVGLGIGYTVAWAMALFAISSITFKLGLVPSGASSEHRPVSPRS